MNKIKSLVEITEEKLLKYINEKEYKKGGRLPNEKDLCRILNVGRSTLREAIKILVFKGIVEVRQGSGTYFIQEKKEDSNLLAIFSGKDTYKTALDLVEARLIIEPAIIEIVVFKATSDDIINLQNICDNIERKIKMKNYYIEDDVEFHQMLALISENEILIAMMTLITKSIKEMAKVTGYTLLNETIISHRKIVNAIKNRDFYGAKYQMIQHLNLNREKIIEKQDNSSDVLKKNEGSAIINANTSDELDVT